MAAEPKNNKQDTAINTQSLPSVSAVNSSTTNPEQPINSNNFLEKLDDEETAAINGGRSLYLVK